MKTSTFIILFIMISFVSAENIPSGGGGSVSIRYTEEEVQQRVYDECSQGFIESREEGKKEQKKIDNKVMGYIIFVCVLILYFRWKSGKKAIPPLSGDSFMSWRDSHNDSHNLIGRLDELEKQVKELKNRR